MRELRDIFSALGDINKQGKPCVLATVVKVTGSAYRHPGARLLIHEDGSTVGMVSAGCLEADLCERGRVLFHQHGREVVTYNLTDKGDLVWGTGLGCAGVIDVLIEYLADPDDFAPYTLLSTYGCSGESGILVTVIRADGTMEGSAGQHMLLRGERDIDFDMIPSPLRENIIAEMSFIVQLGRTRVRSYHQPKGTAEVLVEIIHPPVQLLVFGAGYDAIPVVRFAKTLGWHVTVLDSRRTYATKERFPDADEILLYWNAADVGSMVELSSRTVAVIMTHQYLQDREFLRLMLSSAARYIGLLGPSSRTDQLFLDLKEVGVSPTPEQLSRIYAPIGLNIGTETPEEVALSIVSEIQATLSGRNAGFLKDYDGPLHEKT